VQDRSFFAADPLGIGRDSMHDPRLPLLVAALCRLPAQTRRHLVRHAVKPTRQRLPLADRPGSLGQHQERRLERIFGGVDIAQHVLAHVPDQRPMPQDERLERRLVLPGDEAMQQLRVLGRLLQAREAAQIAQRVEQRATQHQPVTPKARS
jgi:hypothetical protein